MQKPNQKPNPKTEKPNPKTEKPNPKTEKPNPNHGMYFHHPNGVISAALGTRELLHLLALPKKLQRFPP
jgi:hypothetical protein